MNFNELNKDPYEYLTGVRSGVNYSIDKGLLVLIRQISEIEGYTIGKIVQAILCKGLEKYFEKESFDEFKRYIRIESVDDFMRLGINEKSSNALYRAGYKNISELKDADLYDLLKIRNVGTMGAAQILNAINKIFNKKDENSDRN